MIAELQHQRCLALRPASTDITRARAHVLCRQIQRPARAHTHTTHTPPPCAGRFLAAAGEEQLWTVWDVEKRACIASRRLGEVPLSDTCWHAEAGLVGIDEKGAIFRWNPSETCAPSVSAAEDGIDLGEPA